MSKDLSKIGEQSLNYELNKVFIPCRSVLEMEALITLYLGSFNYENIKETQNSKPSSENLIDIFDVNDNEPLMRIIGYFINSTVEKIKPVVMYAREHHGILRMGNILPYTKSRRCVFLALNRLKIKFLLIKKFLETLMSNKYSLHDFYTKKPVENVTMISALFKEFYGRNKMNLELMLPRRNLSETVKKLRISGKSVTNESIINFATYFHDDEEIYKIKYIMRNIKSSLFICKIMFGKMDVSNPFSRAEESEINVEEKMIEYEFIPVLIQSMSNYLLNSNLLQFKECFKGFGFIMNKILDGINNAIEIASNGRIKLELDDTLYDSDKLSTKNEMKFKMETHLSV